MFSPLSYILFLAITLQTVYGSPIPQYAEEPGASPIIVLELAIPFILLLSLKYAYVRYRRAQSIHSYDSGVLEVKSESASQQFIGLGIQSHSVQRRNYLPSSTAITGYLVGCFGSPHWETRIKSHADRAARKASSSISGTFHRDHFSPSEIRSAIAVGSVKSAVNSSSRNTHSRRHTSYSSRAPSVSFLEMASPMMDITSCGNVHPGSPVCPDNLPVALGSKRKPPQTPRRSSRGPRASRKGSNTPPQASPRTNEHFEAHAIVTTEVPSRTDSDTSRSFSQTPSFRNASTTDESSATMSSMSSEQFMASLIYPDHSLILPHDIGYTPTMSSPEKRSPKVTVTSVESIHATMMKTALSPVSRVSPPKTKRIVSPTSVKKTSGSSTGYYSDSNSHGNPTPRPRNAKAAPPVAVISPELYVSESRSISTDWILDDLIKDGMLDVDAVNTALGLGISSQHTDRDSPQSSSHGRTDWKGANTPDNIDVQIRSPGGLLCPIPEESEDISEGDHDGLMPLVGLWEAACRLEPAKEETLSMKGSAKGSVSAPAAGIQSSQWYF